MTEEPYDLPAGWRWVRLGEVAKIFSGSPAPQGREYFEQGTFPFVRVQDLGRHGITTDLKETADKVNERAVRELRLVKASKGTILFPKSGAAILTNSRAILGTDAYIVSHLAGINPSLDVAEPLWVFYWLCTVDMSEYVDNLAYPSLRLSKVKEILIPLPPLPEQRRIVARIEELMARVREARRLREQAGEDAERLSQSVLADTFPRPGLDLPAGWRWVRLGEVCRYDRRTVDPRQSPERTFYLYSIPAYDKGQRPEKLDGSQIGSSKVVVGPGVCLFSKLNPRIPRAWVVAEVPQDGVPVASTEFMPLRPNPDVLDLNYLGNLLVAEAFLSQVQQGVTGATGSRQRLKPEAILNTVIPLPPLEEQRRIVARLEEVQEKIRGLKASQAETKENLKRLEQSILDKAFRGKL